MTYPEPPPLRLILRNPNQNLFASIFPNSVLGLYTESKKKIKKKKKARRSHSIKATSQGKDKAFSGESLEERLLWAGVLGVGKRFQ